MRSIMNWINAKWGRFCLLVFLAGIVVALATSSRTRPSSQFGYFEFFAKADSAAKGIIKDAPPRIRLIMDRGVSVEIDLQNRIAVEGIKVALAGSDLVLQGIEFTTEESTLKKRTSDVVTVTRINEGFEVAQGLDARLEAIDRIYEVKDNVITRHYYRVTQIWGVIFVILVTPIIYIIGKIFIMMRQRKESRMSN